MEQITFFDGEAKKAANNSGFTGQDDGYDYEDDEAEAVVYLISRSGRMRNTALYVMKRHEAVTFCGCTETASDNGAMSWAYCFTTHKRDWRDSPDIFRADDGRFDGLLAEMGIDPIYRGGEPICGGETARERDARIERIIEEHRKNRQPER